MQSMRCGVHLLSTPCLHPWRALLVLCVALQTFALTMPDELTVAHSWKDERKPREYNFDAVFGPGASQDSVSVGQG